ncbi:MAG: hypothetical protein NT072_08700 [Deltaproteobacteria bacterium]|nr:hypothetical protein [Deltaproteobacteria bacterium]
MLRNFLIIRCLRCGRRNRIPRDHLTERPLCGTCGAHLDELIIHCLECGAKNLIPEDRLVDRPRCGRCHAPLYHGSIVSVTDSQFENEVLSFPGPVIVWVGTQCSSSYGDCLEMLGHLAEQYAGGIKIARLHEKLSSNTTASYGISDSTQFLLFKNGTLLYTLTGAVSRADLDHHITMIVKDEERKTE